MHKSFLFDLGTTALFQIRIRKDQNGPGLFGSGGNGYLDPEAWIKDTKIDPAFVPIYVR